MTNRGRTRKTNHVKTRGREYAQSGPQRITISLTCRGKAGNGLILRKLRHNAESVPAQCGSPVTTVLDDSVLRVRLDDSDVSPLAGKHPYIQRRLDPVRKDRRMLVCRYS